MTPSSDALGGAGSDSDGSNTSPPRSHHMQQTVGAGAGAGAGAEPGAAAADVAMDDVDVALAANQVLDDPAGEQEHLDCIAWPSKPVDDPEPPRPVRWRRDIQLAICVTLGQGRVSDLHKTLLAIAKQRDLPWQAVSVFVVCDSAQSPGAEDILNYLRQELGLFDASMLQQTAGDDEPSVTRSRPEHGCHVFERTVRLAQHRPMGEHSSPMQVAFALKTKRGGQVNDHLWFLAGWCRQLNPTYIMLMEAGTMPEASTLSTLVSVLGANPSLAGCGGPVLPEDVKIYELFAISTVAAQLAEVALTKPLGGHRSVSPNLSAWSYDAVRNAPLRDYLFVEECSLVELGLTAVNRYCAPERAFGMAVARRHGESAIAYAPSAKASVDPPSNSIDSWMLRHSRDYRSFVVGRSVQFACRGCCSPVLAAIIVAQWLLQALAPAFCYLLCAAAMHAVLQGTSPALSTSMLLLFNGVYGVTTLVQVVYGMTESPFTARQPYVISFAVFAAIVMFILFVVVHLVMQGVLHTAVLVALAIVVGGHAVALGLQCQLLGGFGIVVHQLATIPAMATMVPVHAMCSSDGVDHLTFEQYVQNAEGPQYESSQRRADMFAATRTRFLTIWLVANIALVVVGLATLSMATSGAAYAVALSGLFLLAAVRGVQVCGAFYNAMCWRRKYASPLPPATPMTAATGTTIDITSPATTSALLSEPAVVADAMIAPPPPADDQAEEAQHTTFL